jgi:hypothetical protein
MVLRRSRDFRPIYSEAMIGILAKFELATADQAVLSRFILPAADRRFRGIGAAFSRLRGPAPLRVSRSWISIRTHLPDSVVGVILLCNNDRSRISMSDDKLPEDPWMAWVEARYALADLQWAEGRLNISPATRDQLRAATNRAAEEIIAQLNQLRETRSQRNDTRVEPA